MRRPVLGALAGALLVAAATLSVRAATITIGQTSILSTTDGGNGNLLLAQQTTLSQPATIVSLSFYVANAAGSLRLGIYDSSGPGGGPGAKKAETPSFAPVIGWNTAATTVPVALPAGTYWLAYLPSSSNLNFRVTTASGLSKYYSFTYATMPATFSTSPSTCDCHWSLYATLTTATGDTSAPSVPAGLAAVPVSPSRIDLAWSPSTDNVGVAGYRIFRNGAFVSSMATTSYSDTGLTANTAYTYTVAAFDAAGNESTQSAPVTTTTPAPAFDFALTNAGNRSVARSASVTNTITATLVSGTAAAVSYSASGLPAGATAGFSPASCSPTCQTTLTITAGASTPLATSTVTVTGAASGLVRTTTFSLTVTAGSDSTPPTVGLTAPANNATVAGTSVAVNATASDNVGVAGVQFLLDGANLGAEDTTSPYGVSWNTTSSTAGTHTLSARARDAAGNTSTAAAVTVTVDNTAPAGTVVINSGAAATNTRTVTLTLSATDPSGVTQMRFSNTGGSYSTAEAYAVTKTWTLTTGAGTKTVYVQFKDAAGNWSAAFTDTIVLDTTAPTVSGVGSSNVTNNSARISWTTNEAATSQVEYGPTTAYGSLTPIDTGLVLSHVVQVTGLSAQTPYNYRVLSKDAAGNQRVGTNNTFVTLPGPDTTPPTAPANLSATLVLPTQINLSWNAASDNVGVTGYLLYRDGIQIASQATLTYSDSNLTPDSSYEYVVYARDAAGNISGPSLPLTVATPAFVISGVAVSNVTSTSALVSWTTDLPTSSAVEYGLTTAYGLESSLDPDMTTSHAVPLSGLAQNSTYHFRVRSTNAAGATLFSGDSVFSTLPAGQTGVFVNESVIANLNFPVSLEFLPDGRMLILEMAGVIRVLRPGASQLDPAPFLQLTNVGTNGIQGLFDMTLHPDFLNNHYYYVFYTAGSPNRDRLSRFTANADFTGTVAGSELIIYQDPLDAASDHHGGALNFGPDGKLYVTTGENFNVNNESQDLRNGRGKILRYNSDGSIPTDNPFHDGAGPNMDAVWALGLRNPFRASFDMVTGRLFIGDVGGNDWDTAVEEVNVGLRGANYGWALCEGYSCGSNPLYTNPIYAYPHNNRDAAVTAGFVYRGTQFPAAYVGSFFFADYAQNWIKRLTFDANGNVDQVLNFEPLDGSADGPYGDIVDLQQGPDGALYYVDIGYSDSGGTTDGIPEIRRIRFISSDAPPVALASADPIEGLAPLSVAFSSAGSSDPENQPLSYLWDFGDGTTATEPNLVHVYSQLGQYIARLTVSDGTTGVLSEPIAITVGLRPTPTILTPSTGLTFRAGDVISFSGDATDSEDGTLPASAFSWTIDFLHGGHVHPGAALTGIRQGTFPIPTTGHDFSGDTRYRITLTATDSDGLRSSASVLVYPQKVNLTFDTVPTGLTVNIDSIAHKAPFVLDTLIGFVHTIEAPNQVLAQTTNTFASWSDGGAQQHAVVVPATDSTYSATFTVTQTSNLVAAYNFDEGTGLSLTDRSGNGNHGSISGATWATGKYGGALQFNGTSSLVTIADAPSLDLTTAFTLEAWVYASVSQSSWSDIIHKAVDSYFLEGSSWGGVAGGILVGGSTHTVVSGVPLVPATWTHVALTFDGSNLRVYVNGTLRATESVTGSVAVSTNPLTLGGNAGGQFFNGRIDDVRIYNRALTEAEIQADMNRPL